MKRIDHCPACGCTEFSQIMDSNLYSFVADRMLGYPINPNSPHHKARVFMCSNCYFSGIDVRFTKEEEHRYYSDYMNDSYNTHRTAYEGTGWLQYQNYYQTPEYITSRKQAAFEVLDSVIDLGAISSVLDYGGNTGEMVPDELTHAKRYLLDVNERTLANGFVAVTDPKQCGAVELVMCSHVMEHVSDPKALLDDIKQYLAPKACLYIEVPSESPGMMTHEHINFIYYEFLVKFLTTNGFDILGGSEIGYEHPMTKSIAIVGQLK